MVVPCTWVRVAPARLGCLRQARTGPLAGKFGRGVNLAMGVGSHHQDAAVAQEHRNLLGARWITGAL